MAKPKAAAAAAAAAVPPQPPPTAPAKSTSSSANGTHQTDVSARLRSATKQQQKQQREHQPDRDTRLDVIDEKEDRKDAKQQQQGGGDLSTKDKKAIALLVVLYLLQGVPVGLAFGTMPFLLKAHLSYSDIGFFMLSTYPYSLKLLWSPVVDSCFVNSLWTPLGTLSLGRRKSWIVPIQAIVGVLLWMLGTRTDELLLTTKPDIVLITSLFFVLVLFAATQDIAVDGWALTLLSEENLSYASTAQTVGLNTGYFLSFTVFLALNSVEFGNKYFRAVPLDTPLLSLSAYLKISAVCFLAVTAWLLLFKREDPEAKDQPDMDVRGVYSTMLKICSLKHVQSFLLVHLVAKIGFQANDAVTGLKLVEKGFGKEDLALTVLIDFPFQLVLGYLAARWSKGDHALRPWLWGYAARLGFAVASMALVAGVPKPPIGAAYFFVIIASTVLGSFASTVQFVGISAFHTQVADPLIGGTYMTLLNTVSNLGGTWPRYFVLKAVDSLTVSRCVAQGVGGKAKAALASAVADSLDATQLGAAAALGRECHSDAGRAACAAISGSRCDVSRDGYYVTSAACVALGAVAAATFIVPTCRRLQALPASSWRVSSSSSSSSSSSLGGTVGVEAAGAGAGADGEKKRKE